MIEFEVQGISLRMDKLNAFEQWDITRRLLPVVGGAADTLMKLFEKKGGTESLQKDIRDLLGMDISKIIEPLTKALGSMTDADSHFILQKCLGKVMRQQGDGWAPIMHPSGQMMFLDIDMPVMLEIVWKVLEANLLNFSRARPEVSR